MIKVYPIENEKPDKFEVGGTFKAVNFGKNTDYYMVFICHGEKQIITLKATFGKPVV